MEFTSWDAGLRRDELEHHGIPGMKWGVRRYQNKDGSLTPIGKRRYAGEGTSASARKMQRDFNNLDKGYANIAAERHYAGKRMNKYANKALRFAAKKGLRTPEEMAANKRMTKYGNKMQKSAAKAKLSEQQMKSIENLQWRILQKAAAKGYTTKSKQVVRYGNTARQRGIANAVGVLMGGGALTGAAVGGILGSKSVRVDGQKVKIRKKGDGSTQIVDYSRLNEEERRRRQQNRG